MSSAGAGGLDLNCDTAAVLDNPESGGQAFDAIGDEKKECVRGAADGKDELAGGEEEIGRSELGGVSEESRERSEVGQGDLVAGRGQDSDGHLSSGEKEAESCDGMLLEMDTGMKGREKPVTVLAEGFESADSSNQGVHLEYGSGRDQNKGSDLYDHGALGTRNKELAVEFDGGEISEVDKGEKRSSELVAVSSEGFALVEVAGQAMDLGDKPGCDQKQGTDVGAQALVRTGEDLVAVSDDGGGPEDERLEGSSVLREQQVEISLDFVDGGGQVGGGESGPWEREDKIESRSGKLLEVYMGEKRTTELVAVSAEGFEDLGACSQVMDLGDGSDVNQKLRADVDAVCMVGTDEEVAASFGGVGHEDEMLEGSSILGKEPVDVQEDMVVGHVQDVDDELSPGKLETGVQSHRGELLEVDTGEKRSAELVCISGEGFYVVGSSNQAMELEDGNGSDRKRGIVIDAEVRTNEISVAVSVGSGEPKASRLEGSSILVKELIEDGEDTSGTKSQVKDLAQPMEIEDAGNDAIRHDGQIQQEFGGDQRRGADVGAEGMVGRSEEASPVVSVGCVGPENERLESSSSLGDKQLEIEDYTNGMRPVENNVVHLVEIASGGVDAIRHVGHVQDSVHHEDVEDLDPGEGVDGDQKSESYVEIDAKLVVGAVTCQGDQILGLEGAQNFEGEQVIVNYTSDGQQTAGKVVNSQKSGDRVHDDMVCDLVTGHSDDIEGEIVGGSGHNLAEVNFEFTAGKEDIMEKGLACLQESLKTANNSLNHALVEGDPVGDRYPYQAILVTYNKQEDISLGIFQGASLEMRRGDTSTDHWSASEEIEDPQAFYVENDQKTCGQNSTAAGETVQMRDSILIAEEQDLGSRQIYGEIFITAAGGTNVCDVSGTTLAPEAANMEAWSAEVHTIDKNIEKKLEVVLEANGSVMDLTSYELENEGARLNFDHQGCKTDSSFMMVSCKGEEAHAASTQSCDGFFVEKGCSNMEDSKSHLSISMPESSEEPVNLTFLSQQNEPSAGCQDVQPSDVPSRECKIVKDLEAGVGTPALEHALQAVDEPIDSTQSLQDGKNVHLKEAGNQSEECNGTRTQLASLSRQATYYLSVPEKEGFSISDLVWGKVKSHPWWPGQIVDLSDASKLAIKYQKKDHFLVAYFGDKTFAWCEESRLKPFQLYFLQMEKQSSSESFLRAVGDILMEISRRIQLVMTCLCLPEEAYSDIKYQKLENAGVNGKTVCTVIDRYEVVNCFHADKLLEYIRALAELPTGGADRLDLTVAQAQLKAFYLSKGYTELPAFTNGSGLVENDFEIPSSVSKELKKDDLQQSATLSNLLSAKGKSRGRDGIPLKQKHIVEDGRRQQSPSELVEEKTTFLHENGSGNGSVLQEDENCISSGNKRKVVDFDSNDIGRSKIKKLDSIADKEYKSLPTSNISFKVGEFISRAASKLTGGHPIRKCHGVTSEGCLSRTDYRSIDDMDIDDFLDIPFDNPKVLVDISGDYPPSNEMLSQLCLAARNPMKGCNLLSAVISFFTAFRNVQVSNFSIEKNIIEKPRAKRGRKKKIISDLATPDMSTPDHMKDSYWSDVIFPEKDAILNPPKRRGRKRRKPVGESSPSHLLSSPPDCEPKLHIGTVCPHVKHRLTAERPIIIVEEKIVDERTPTAVILYFNSSTSLPSETDIIRIFSRYGPLKEAETYIERKTNSAMVVFKKRADAEMAFSSAEKFSAFGPALVSYRLKNFTSQPSPKNAVKNESDDAPIKAEAGSGAAFIENLVKASDKSQVEATMGEECSVSVPNETEAVNIAARDDDLGTEQSYFVQTQMDGGNTQVETGCAGGFSEFVRYQVVDVVVSDSIKANTARKEPSEDIPALMETGTVSDHFLLESLEQELSYFDLDQAGSGAISDDMQVETVCQDFSVSIVEHVEVGVISDLSPVEVTDEKSSLHLFKKEEPEGVSNDATFESVGQESCVCALTVAKTATGAESATDIVVSGSCDFVEDQLEKQIVLEKTSQHEAVDHELFDIAPDQPEENHCFDSAPAQVSTGALVGSSVTIDVQSQLKESSDYVQDNQGIGIHSCVMEVQVIAEDPSQSVPAQRAQREIRTVSDAMQVEVMGRVPYVSVTIAEEAGMPSCVTQAALPEDKSTNSVHDEAMNGRFSDSAEVGSINKESYDPVPSAMETGIISDATHVENQDKESSAFILSAGKIGNVSQVERTGEEPSGVVKVHEGVNLSDTPHKLEDQEGFL